LFNLDLKLNYVRIFLILPKQLGEFKCNPNNNKKCDLVLKNTKKLIYWIGLTTKFIIWMMDPLSLRTLLKKSIFV